VTKQSQCAALIHGIATLSSKARNDRLLFLGLPRRFTPRNDFKDAMTFKFFIFNI